MSWFLNKLYVDIGFYFFVGAIGGVLSQPFVGSLADKVNKRKFLFSLLICHIIWPLLLFNFISIPLIIILSVIVWGFASVSIYTVALAYLGERVSIKEISIATSVFIIIYEGGEFFGPIIVGLSMNKFGNLGFIYSILSITIISLILGIIRTIFKNNENKNY